MKSILKFKDYRKYLLHLFEEEKQRVPRTTYTSFSQKLGLLSPQYFKWIIEGKRNLSIHQALTLGELLDLSQVEINYFVNLVQLNHAQTPLEQKFFKKICNDLNPKDSVKKETLIGKSIFSDWYYPIVLLLLDGASIDTGTKKLEEKLGLSRKASEELIANFLQTNVFGIEDNKYKINFSYLVQKDTDRTRESYRNFVKGQLKSSLWAFQNQSKINSKFYTHIFTVEAGKKYIFDNEIQEFLQKLSQISDLQKPDEFVILNLQFFPTPLISDIDV